MTQFKVGGTFGANAASDSAGQVAEDLVVKALYGAVIKVITDSCYLILVKCGDAYPICCMADIYLL